MQRAFARKQSRISPNLGTEPEVALVAPETSPLSTAAVPIARRFATLQFRRAKSATLVDLIHLRGTKLDAPSVRLAAAGGQRADR